ncbi:unnamed protein product [Rhizophagus irregularis]|nr:unnamed protein product [Rhizophagus irregularis]
MIKSFFWSFLLGQYSAVTAFGFVFGVVTVTAFGFAFGVATMTAFGFAFEVATVTAFGFAFGVATVITGLNLTAESPAIMVVRIS